MWRRFHTYNKREENYIGKNAYFCLAVRARETMNPPRQKPKVKSMKTIAPILIFNLSKLFLR